MRGMTGITRRCLVWVWGFMALCLQAQPIELPEISGQWEGDVKPIVIDSAQSEVARLAKYAFGVHGAFHVETKGGLFTLRLTPDGDRAVKLDILSGVPAKVQFSERVEGESLSNATLRACDVAVRKLTGEPGFFAGELAFISDRGGVRELYCSDLFFQNVRRLTNHHAKTVSPHWSPDGNSITYTSYFKSGFPDLFLYDVKASRVRPLATFKGTNTGGVYDPMGSRMALVLSASGNPELYLANASGKNLKRLTNNRSLEASPTWSPDGQSLIFTSDRGGAPQLYEMSVAGGPMKRLPTNISRYCAEADWNPVHPELVVFTASNAGGFQLALYDRKTRQSRWLTAGGGDNIEACWLNDGRHLVFTQRSGKTQRLHIMDVKTGAIRPLHSLKFGNVSQAAFLYR